MEWFKYMKHIQGSASTKTFEQIKSINRGGCYTIGNTGRDFDSYLTNETQLKDGICLQVNTKRSTHAQKMTLSEIEDLQSSLMLLGREARGGAENHDEAETEKNYFIQVRSFLSRYTLRNESPLPEKHAACSLKSISLNIKRNIVKRPSPDPEFVFFDFDLIGYNGYKFIIFFPIIYSIQS